jgi:bifunctional DNA-binding transcriptional regulator/antitoxin component of YhaV-PrlF toxin-antitoxin module
LSGGDGVKEGEPTTRVVRVLRSGQITIPVEFRKALGIDADSVLRLTLDQGELRIQPVAVSGRAQGSPWLRELYDAFADVRAQLEQYSEEEINTAIDQAVAAVRKSHAYSTLRES